MYSVFVSIFSPDRASVSLNSSSSAVIFAYSRYLDFSVPFFHTQLYLFAFASNFEPSIYRCYISTPSFSRICSITARNMFSILSVNSSLYPQMTSTHTVLTGRKNVHTSSNPLAIHKVFPAVFSSSDRFSAPAKLLCT